MKIGFDTTPLTTNHISRGTGRYARMLLESLKHNEKKHNIIEYKRVQKVSNKFDLVHFPFFDPFFLTLKPLTFIPYVVTVHDLIPLDFPKNFPRGIRGEVKWQIQKKTVEQSRRIITDSYASKESILHHISYSPDKIDVIHLASTLDMRYDPSKNTLPDIKGLKLSLPYFLYVGDVNWNKNIIGMLMAFRNYKLQTINHFGKQKNHTEFPNVLVLVGKSFQNNSITEVKEILQAINNLGIRDNVMILGRVTDDELRLLYTNAVATLIPSFAEGFGLPILEAMRYGSLVITSNCSSMKEIAGPSFLCDPFNTESLTNQMEKVIMLSLSERKKIIHEGILWEKQYTWKKVSEDTIRTYEKALER